MAKPARPKPTSKIIHFKLQSEYEDVGSFSGKFELLRWTPAIESNIVAAKAQMLGGVAPADGRDGRWVTAICTVANAVEPADGRGPTWLNDVGDKDVVFGLYNEWMAYQESFKRKPEATDAAEAEADPSVQG